MRKGWLKALVVAFSHKFNGSLIFLVMVVKRVKMMPLCVTVLTLCGCQGWVWAPNAREARGPMLTEDVKLLV